MNKKSITLIAGAAMLVLGVPAITMAQTPAASGPFADVPADHWAYQSVDTLQKAGIVIGYPDGTYGGHRAMTRYEFAVAIARLLPLLNPKVDTSNFATKDDLASARQDLEQKLQANSDAIDALKKLVDEFTPELQKLGQDVAAVNSRLDALEARVAAVEEEQRRVKFTGALNIIAMGEDVTKGTEVYDQNGNAVEGVNPIPKHILADTAVTEDFVLGITGKVSDTATANVKLDFGDYLSTVGNVAAPGFDAEGNNFDGNSQATLWEANLQAPVGLGPLGDADLTVGRFGNQWTKYTLQQVDADIYTNLYQTDSGNITTDGIKAVTKAGPIGLNMWAGQFNNIPFSQPWGGPITNGARTLPTGLQDGNLASALSQGAGVRGTIGNPNNWVLGASVEQFGLTQGDGGYPFAPGTENTYQVLSVYGADFNGAVPFFKEAGLKLDLNWTDAAIGSTSSGFNNRGNGWQYQSTDDELAFNVGGLDLKGGYQYVGPNFTAPGYWGRVGGWINPTNIEGPVVSAKYNVSPKIRLNADYEGWQAAYAANNSPLTKSAANGSDKLDRYQVGVGFDLTSAYAVDLGYENDTFNLKNTDTPGKPVQSYITLGLGHRFNENASFKVEYQIAQYQDKSTGFGPAGDNTGNIAVGQFQLKF
jgi:FtsZ-binding cell division protein ZapB